MVFEILMGVGQDWGTVTVNEGVINGLMVVPLTLPATFTDRVWLIFRNNNVGALMPVPTVFTVGVSIADAVTAATTTAVTTIAGVTMPHFIAMPPPLRGENVYLGQYLSTPRRNRFVVSIPDVALYKNYIYLDFSFGTFSTLANTRYAIRSVGSPLWQVVVSDREDWSHYPSIVGMVGNDEVTTIDLAQIVAANAHMDPDPNLRLIFRLNPPPVSGPVSLDVTIDAVDEVVAAIAEKAFTSAPSAPGTASERIVCWGDSLTAMGGWPDTIASDLGVSVLNAGTGGEGSGTIMARQGGDVMTISGVTIPGDTSTVTLVPADPNPSFPTTLGDTAGPLRQGGSSHVNPVKIDGIEGTLVWTGSTYNDPVGTYTFSRTTAGTVLTIDRPTPMTTFYDRSQNVADPMIIFMGQNDGVFDPATMVQKHQLMIAHFPGKKFLILGLSSGTAASRADYESAMTAAFGRRFISLRQYLVSYGLEDTGLTATQADMDAISVGQVPPQLLLDGTHYTAVTRTAVGHMLSRAIQDLGLVLNLNYG